MVINKMYNADLNATADTTQEAYDAIYQFRGWVMMDEKAALATDIVGRPVIKVEDLTIDEARRVIASVGVEQPPSGANKADVMEALDVAFAGGVVPAEPSPEEQAVVAPVEDPEPAAAKAKAAKN